MVNKLIYLILAIHFMSSLIAVYKDYYLNFSSAREVAEFLKKNNLTNSEIIGHRSAVMIGISGYLDGKEIFFLEENRYGTFKKWDLEKMNEVNYSLIDLVAERLAKNNKVLLILHVPIDEYAEDYSFNKIFESEESIVEDEKFYIYNYRP